jgi:DnaJ-class molecular chaperone
MFRLLFFAALIGLAYYLAKLILKPSATMRCTRCEGKGFWYAARGKETCDWCKGSGQLPRK